VRVFNGGYMSNYSPTTRGTVLPLFLALSMLAVFISSQPAQAQPESMERIQPEKRQGKPISEKSFFEKWSVRINTNAEHMFNTNIDGGGKFNITRLGLNHDATFTATERLRITFGSSYNYYNFDFSGSQGLAGLRPWRNMSVSNNSMRVSYALTRNWGVFAMPIISYGAESGAPFWDSFTIGAMAGVSYRTGPNFIIGIGGFVGSRLEQSVIGFPIGFLDWRVTERLRFSTLASGARNDFGPKAELSYNLGRGFIVASSIGFEFNRFRLEKDGNFSEGIGDFKALPLMGRISYDVNKYLTLNTYGGFLFAGSLELEDKNGNRISKEDYDTAPIIGASITVNISL
jgi:hypothetical protein